MSRWYSNETQIRWACLQLIKGREISHACEIAEVKGWRLAAIIWRLIHRYNWPIQKREGVNGVAYYRLGHGVEKSGLEMPRSFHLKKKGDVAASPGKPEK